MKSYRYSTVIMLTLLIIAVDVKAQVSREFELKVSDSGLYFNGEQRKSDFHIDNPGFEYYFGRRITPHGDCIKKYGDFLFLTWYLGGEENRNVMLTRLHIPSQTLETIKFEHTHVGYRHQYPHIGDSHNTIAVGICPLDSTVHLLYDMHSYSKLHYPDSYFNYQASFNGAANAPVGSFTRDLFKPRQTYLNPAYDYSDITYPNFFLNDDNELFVWFREGGHNNGMYKFARYTDGVWGPFTNFNSLNAVSYGNPYNWGLYGDLKYINGKLRVGFVKRMSYNDDKYVYNNGFHYGYTNDPSGKTEWFNHKDEGFSLPVINPEELFFYEPGDVVTQGGANSVSISSGPDFTVTDEEAVHFIVNNVRSMVDGKSKNVHAYKKAGVSEFTISTNFPGGNLYAVDGNQVYLMSSNNNRPEIYRAEGGTNKWEKLYTETAGIAMEHSNVLIADGKLFVYAMQKSSGDARPLYIQMYDLGIDTSRYLSFKNLHDGQEIELGADLSVEARVGSAFKSVSLWVDTINLGALSQAPYNWSGHSVLTNMRAPSYSLRLIAMDSASASTEKRITLFTPEDTTRKVSFKSPVDGAEIERGSDVIVEAKVGSALTEVSLWYGDTNLGTLTNAPYIWSSHALLSDLTEASYLFKLVASDGEGFIAKDSITIYTFVPVELSDKNSLHISFEENALANWETDGSDYGVIPEIAAGTNVREGSKVMKMSYSGGTSGHHIQNIADKIAVPDQYYFHMIAYTATSDVSYGQTYPTAQLGDWKPTPSFTGHAADNVFERKVTSRQNTTGDSLNCFPRIRSKANGGACIIYYDDIVLYASADAEADLIAPFAASNLSVDGQLLSWSNGSDAETEIISTLILRSSDVSAEAPELVPQVAYGTVGLENVGAWKVIAVLDESYSTFNDTAAAIDLNYSYAVVHKDLAYNYSEPVVGESEASSLLRGNPLANVQVYGVDGAIRIEKLRPGQRIRVFDLLGRPVIVKVTDTDQMEIAVPPGIYIVNISGNSAKVIVK